MSYSLNSLKGGDLGEGIIVGIIKEGTRSFDYSSYGWRMAQVPQQEPVARDICRAAASKCCEEGRS